MLSTAISAVYIGVLTGMAGYSAILHWQAWAIILSWLVLHEAAKGITRKVTP